MTISNTIKNLKSLGIDKVRKYPNWAAVNLTPAQMGVCNFFVNGVPYTCDEVGFYKNSTTVPKATGNSAVDALNILNAFNNAGNNGIVVFPEKNTYIIEGVVTPTAFPAKVIGNGSIIKKRNQVSTTIASGTLTAGSNVAITLTDVSNIKITDKLLFSDGNGTFTYTASITNIVGSVVTLSSVTFANGTSIGAGGVCVVEDKVLIKFTATGYNMEISGLTFDGNATNQQGAISWAGNQLLAFSPAATSYTSKVIIHHNIFINAACDAFAANDTTFLSIHNNHFENIFGFGVHPGGNGYGVDYECKDNTFKNVCQLTASSSPTATQYGHTSAQGAIATSNSPKRAIVTGNIVDESNGFGFDGVTNIYTTECIVSNNVFYNCDRGGFHISNAGCNVIVSNNIIQNCGHDISYFGSVCETSTVNNSSVLAKTIINSNIFYNSTLTLANSAKNVVISNNIFDCVTLQKQTTWILGCIHLTSACSDIDIIGNKFNLPETRTQCTAVSNNVLPAIFVKGGSRHTIKNNTVNGGSYGVQLQCTTVDHSVISNNSFINQCDYSSNTNCAGVYTQYSFTGNNLVIANNSFALTSASDTQNWIGINLSNTAAGTLFSIKENNIKSDISPGTTHVGILFQNTALGTVVKDNHIWLNNGASGNSIKGTSLTSATQIINNISGNGNTLNIASATISGNISM